MQTQIAADVRTTSLGKGAGRKLRAAGRLPAVVYAKGQPAVPVHVDPKALLKLFKETENKNTVVELQVDGEVWPALVREVQRHPLTRKILHLDFLRVYPDRPLELLVPLRTVGRAAGMAIGGRIRLVRREVKVRCTYDRIPKAVEYDITLMRVDDVVHVSELRPGEGVTVLYDNDFIVIHLYGKRAELDDFGTVPGATDEAEAGEEGTDEDGTDEAETDED